MSSKIETKNSPSETQLLDELRSTVITRWDEFDNALPIGASFKSEYQSMKSAYDWLIADISPIKTDAELKQNQAVKTKLDTFLKQLSDYLKREDRRKDLDGTLVETNTQIAKLRDGIYIQRTVQAESGKLQQEVATNKPASTPDKKQESLPTTTQVAAVAAVGGTGVVAAIESGGKKAEEAVKGIMKPLEKIKKWSSDIGSAWDAGWELVKKGDISKGIWLFFAVLFGGNLKDALAKYTGKKDEMKPADKKEEEKMNNEKYDRYYASVWVFQSINKPALEKYSGDVRSTWDSILKSEAFMNLDFNIVWSMMQKDFQKGAIVPNSLLHQYMDANIVKSLGYESKRSTYEAVQYALLTIYYRNNESFIGKHISTEFERYQKDNKNATIRQTVEALSDEITLASNLNSVDITNGMESLGWYLSIDPNTKTLNWVWSDVVSKWFSPDTIKAFLRNAPNRLPNKFEQKDFDNDTSLKNAKPEEVQKLIDFRRNITKSISTNVALTFNHVNIIASINTAMSKLSYLDTLQMYAVFGGKTDTKSMGIARSTALYPWIVSLLEGETSSQKDEWAYKILLLGELRKFASWGASHIPKETANFMVNAGKKVGVWIWDTIANGVKEWWGMLEVDPATTLIVTPALLYLFVQTRWFPAKGRRMYEIWK
mgnify:FL=1